MNAFLKTQLKLALFSHRFFMKFHYFLGIDFRIDFFIVFWWKRLPKWSQKVSRESSKIHTFRDLLIYVDFMLLLCWTLLTLGSFLAPLGWFWAPFGSLLVHFWCPLAHFWCLGFTFGDPGARGDPFSIIFAIFSEDSSLVTHPSRARSGTFAAGNLDPLRARGRPGVLAFAAVLLSALHLSALHLAALHLSAPSEISFFSFW